MSSSLILTYTLCVFDFVKAQAMRLSWGGVEFFVETPAFPCVISCAAERVSGLRGGFKGEAVGREVVFAVAGESMGRLRTGLGAEVQDARLSFGAWAW